METDGRVLLMQELMARKNRNPAYSLRAFARDLGISPAALSQYLSRQRELSKKNRLLVCQRLQFSPLQSQTFLEIAPPSAKQKDREILREEEFRLIADWVSVALLNLALIQKNRANSKWIAKRLNISVPHAQEAFERLQRLKLIHVEEGRMRRTAKPFQTTQDIPSEAIRRMHLGILGRAQQAILDIPVESRDITALILPSDPAVMKKVKEILAQTKKKISSLMDKSDPTQVSVLALQYFPLTQEDE